jgi:methionyl-tRNA synthetase
MEVAKRKRHDDSVEYRLGRGDNCSACGEELSPVEVLAVLADS